MRYIQLFMATALLGIADSQLVIEISLSYRSGKKKGVAIDIVRHLTLMEYFPPE